MESRVQLNRVQVEDNEKNIEDEMTTAALFPSLPFLSPSSSSSLTIRLELRQPEVEGASSLLR